MKLFVRKNQDFVMNILNVFSMFLVFFFYSFLKDDNRVIYSFSYAIYAFIFLFAHVNLSFTMGNIFSEYQVLGHYRIEKRAFYWNRIFSFVLGILLFLCFFFLTPVFTNFIMNGSKTMASTVRLVGFSFVLQFLLSAYRGYFIGHHMDTICFQSYVVEFLMRFLVIIGCYIGCRWFHWNVMTIFIGLLVELFLSFSYLVLEKYRNRKILNQVIRPVNEPVVSTSTLLKKIASVTFFTLLINSLLLFCPVFDLFTMMKNLMEYGHYSEAEAKEIYSFFVVGSSLFIFLLVWIVAFLFKGIDTEKLHKNKIQTVFIKKLTLMFFVLVPITLLISFLAEPICLILFGNTTYSGILSYAIFIGFFLGLYVGVLIFFKYLKDYKRIFISLGISLLLKIIFNDNLFLGFYQMGLSAYYGMITATILSYFIPFIYCLFVFHFHYKVAFEMIIKNIMDIICMSVFMIFVLFLLRFIIPYCSDYKIISILLVIGYFVLGIFVYFWSFKKMFQNISKYL